MENKKQNIWIGVLFALLAYVVLFFVTRLFYLPGLVLMVPLVFISARCGFGLGAGLCLLLTGAAYLLYGYGGLVLSVMVLPFVCVTGVMIRQKRSAWSTLLGTCGAALGSIGLWLLYIYCISGADVTGYLLEAAQASIKSSDEITAGLYAMVQQNEATTLSFESMFAMPEVSQMRSYLLSSAGIAELKQLTNLYLPQLIMLYIVFGGVCGFFISRTLVKRAGGAVVAVPGIENLRLPKQHGNCLLILLCAMFIPILFEIQNLLLPAEMVISLVYIIFAIQGFSVAVYFLRIWIKNKAGSIVLAAFAYMLFPFLVTLLGMIDHLLGIRQQQTGL